MGLPEEKIIKLELKDRISEQKVFNQFIAEAEIDFLKKCLCDELDRGTSLIKMARESALAQGLFIGFLAGILVMGFYIEFYLFTVN